MHYVRVRSEADAQKHMKRRQKRKRQKVSKDESGDNAEATHDDTTELDDTMQQQPEDGADSITAADELAHLQVRHM